MPTQLFYTTQIPVSLWFIAKNKKQKGKTLFIDGWCAVDPAHILQQLVLSDILGRTYEYCLSKFAEQEGKLAGEFYTPACVVRTLVEILQPYNGRVYDPWQSFSAEYLSAVYSLFR